MMNGKKISYQYKCWTIIFFLTRIFYILKQILQKVEFYLQENFGLNFHSIATLYFLKY